jgi:hypothetical protein
MSKCLSKNEMGGNDISTLANRSMHLYLTQNSALFSTIMTPGSSMRQTIITDLRTIQ